MDLSENNSAHLEPCQAGHTLVLVAEPEPQIQELVRYLQHEAKYQVKYVESGVLGLQCARTLLPELVVCEILLPDLDGLSICRELKRDSATRRIPVLLISILCVGARALEAGADAFLRRPLHGDELLLTAQRLLAASTPSD